MVRIISQGYFIYAISFILISFIIHIFFSLYLSDDALLFNIYLRRFLENFIPILIFFGVGFGVLLIYFGEIVPRKIHKDEELKTFHMKTFYMKNFQSFLLFFTISFIIFLIIFHIIKYFFTLTTFDFISLIINLSSSLLSPWFIYFYVIWRSKGELSLERIFPLRYKIYLLNISPLLFFMFITLNLTSFYFLKSENIKIMNERKIYSLNWSLNSGDEYYEIVRRKIGEGKTYFVDWINFGALTFEEKENKIFVSFIPFIFPLYTIFISLPFIVLIIVTLLISGIVSIFFARYLESSAIGRGDFFVDDELSLLNLKLENLKKEDFEKMEKISRLREGTLQKTKQIKVRGEEIIYRVLSIKTDVDKIIHDISDFLKRIDTIAEEIKNISRDIGLSYPDFMKFERQMNSFGDELVRMIEKIKSISEGVIEIKFKFDFPSISLDMVEFEDLEKLILDFKEIFTRQYEEFQRFIDFCSLLEDLYNSILRKTDEISRLIFDLSLIDRRFTTISMNMSILALRIVSEELTEIARIMSDVREDMTRLREKFSQVFYEMEGIKERGISKPTVNLNSFSFDPLVGKLKEVKERYNRNYEKIMTFVSVMDEFVRTTKEWEDKMKNIQIISADVLSRIEETGISFSEMKKTFMDIKESTGKTFEILQSFYETSISSLQSVIDSLYQIREITQKILQELEKSRRYIEEMGELEKENLKDINQIEEIIYDIE